MINLPAVVIANGAAVMLLFIVMLSRKKNIRYGLFDENLYGSMLLVNIMLCVTETLTFCVDGMNPELYRPVAVMLNSANFMFNALFTFLWTLYVDYKIFEDMKRIRNAIRFLAIPAYALIIGCIINIYIPIFFSVSADNIYKRESLHMIPFIITYAYLLYGVILIYTRRKKAKRYLFLPVIIFLVPVLIASIIQYMFYGVSLLWLGTAIGLISLYINVQNQTTYIDSLSGVFNRQYLGNVLAAWAEHPATGKCLVGFMLDIDGFKMINDRHGHLSGDRVITDAGMFLRSAAGKGDIVARYGGDEFVIVKYFDKERMTPEILDKAADSLRHMPKTPEQEFQINFSSGYSVFEETDTVDSFIGKMDAAMYVDKNNKQSIPDKTGQMKTIHTK